MIVLPIFFFIPLTCFVADDVPFALRIVDQVFLCGSASDLKEEAQKLADIVRSVHPTNDTNTRFALEEKCPACSSPVPFDDNTMATCLNGHIWGELTEYVQSLEMRS